MRKVIKVILIILGSLLFLIAGALVYLNTPSGQNFVRGKAEGFLRKKIKTELHIGYLGVGFPKYIVLRDIFFRDQKSDTLLSLRELKVDISMWELIHKKVEVQQVLLTGVHSHIYRMQPDTTYNFSYIIDAFAGGPKDTTKVKDTTKSSPLSISLDKVRLDDIHVKFDDVTGGMKLGLDLEHLDLRMKTLDLDKMAFHIRDLNVAGLRSSFAQDTSYLPPKPKKENTKTELQLVADNIDLQRIGFNYNDALNNLLFALDLGSLQLQLKKFGLANNLVDLDKLVINNTNMVLTMGKNARPPAPIDTLIKKDTTQGWNVSAGNISFSNVGFKMDNENQPRQPAGIDYSHLDLKDLAVSLQNVRYTSDSMSGNLKHLAVKERSGVDVKELRTVFSYNQQGAVLSKLYLQTPQTLLQDHLEVHYPSIATIKDSLARLQLRVNLLKSKVAMSDVLIFVPDLIKQDMFRKNRNAHLDLEAKMTGYLDDLNIARFYAAGLESTEVLLTGKLRGLPDSKKLSYSFNIAKLQTSRNDVSGFVPDSTLKAIRLPDRFGVTGTIAGTVQDYNTNIYFTSTDGLAYVRGTLAMSPGKGREKYDMVVNLANLNLGRILKQDSVLGAVTANFVARGTGFDPKAMAATVDGKIISAFVKGYRYHDILMYAKVAAQKGNIDLSSADPNVRILLKADADLTGKYAAIKADLKIDSIDFQALKLYKTELRASGTIHADFPVLNPDYPEGKFIWWQPVVTADGKRYFLDSLYVISKPSADSGQNIVADLGVLRAKIKGRIPLTKTGTIIQEHINRHYTFAMTDSARTSMNRLRADSMARRIAEGRPRFNDTAKVPRAYSLTVSADVIDRPMLRGILPGLTSFDSIHVGATITPRILNLDVSMPNLVYSGTTVENGVVQVRATDSAFTYKVTVDQVSKDKFSFFYANIHGKLDQNTISTNISLSDSSKKERFAVVANMQKLGDSQIVHLQPGLKLDYKDWNVAVPNRIVLYNGGFYISNFEISNSGQFIRANSATAQINTPMKVDISNFMLSNITQALSNNDTLLADGKLSGTVNIQRMTPALQMNADLKIEKLSVLGDTLGNLAAQVNNEKENALSAKVQLKEQGNDIAVDGTYYLKTQNGNDFDFNVDVNALSLKSFESLAGNQIHNSSGFIRGKLQLQGTAKAPVITGELRTENLATTVTQLNAEFKMPAEKISFTKDRVSLSNFTILDKDNNKATIDGGLDISNLSDIGLDLRVNANKWHPLHSTVKDNKVFYGDLFVTTNINVSGSVGAPAVDGTIKVLKGTKITVVNQDSNPQIESRKGIVVFVNMKDTARRNILVPRKARDTTKRRMASGSDVNVNVSIDKDAELSLVIDKSSGDFLNVKGDANINASLTPGGTLSLTGSYALSDGAYQLNYNFIKRKFKIANGSMITFAGDPVKGTMLDITAVYQAMIPPYDLVQRQVPDPTQLNYYKQRLPFDVNLYMRGPVLTPRLSFDVVLPENKGTRLTSDQMDLIQGKLNQVRTDTGELNKQVFAVLILNRFVSDDPFSSGAGSSATFTALQSVSTFIGEQLNQAAGKFVKGVDFSVDLATTEDYTTGNLRQRTDLNLAASKQLLNDRLKLTIGNNFELDGPQTSNDQNSYVPTNLAADYLLSADGKYTLRGYRRAYDEGVLQGYVTETGLNFIVSLDYNKFKNVFRKKKPANQDNGKRSDNIMNSENNNSGDNSKDTSSNKNNSSTDNTKKNKKKK